MNLNEIKAAIAHLSLEQWEELSRHLLTELQHPSIAGPHLVLENGRSVLVAGTGSSAMTTTMVKAALADFL